MRWLLALLVALLLLVSPFTPGLRAALAGGEPALPVVLFLAAAALWLLPRWIGPGRRRRGLLRAEARWSRALGPAAPGLAVLAFLLPVWGQEQGAPSSRVPATAMLAGRIPWLDANGHIEGAHRLLAEGHLNRFTERRPFNTPWLALRLRLGGLEGALWLQALLLGLAAALLARSLAASAGRAAGLAGFALVYGYARDYAAVPVSEPLGISLACVAFAMLLVCARQRSLASFGAGLLLLELALRTRPGAQFLLPCVLVWGWLWLRDGKRVLLAGLLALATGELTTRGLLGLYGSGQASFSSYPAFTLYGLTHDANYVKAKQDFAAELASRPETEVSRLMYAAALRRVRERPGDLVHALASNLGRFIEKLPANTARTLSPRALFARGSDWIRPDQRQMRLDAWLAAPILAGTSALALLAWRRRGGAERGLWLALLGGTLASAPFVYGDAGFRGLAVGQPALAGALALAFASRARPRWPAGDSRGPGAALSFAAAMIGLALAAPPLLRVAAPGRSASLEPGDALLDLRLASALVIDREGGTGSLAPHEYYRRLGYAQLVESRAWSRRAPFALVSAFDRLTGSQRIVFAPAPFLEPATPLRRARLRRLADGDADAEGSAPPLFVVDDWAAAAP